jgi:tetrahydromethanopterin S-methyltransferase subunit F
MTSFLKRLAVAVAVFVISGAAVLVATFFLFASIYFWFEENLSPPAAALATAGVLIGFALLVILLGVLLVASFKRRPQQRYAWLIELLDAPDGLSAAAIGNAIGRKLQSFARENAQATVVASLLAGLAIGISPGLRALLRDVLKD